VNVDHVVRAVDEQAVRNWAVKVKHALGLEKFNVYHHHNGDLYLDMLVVPRIMREAGVGTAAMQVLTEYADAAGKRVLLTPGVRDNSFGTTSHARLVKFYKRFGFYENKGRKKDFTTMAGMIRDPRSR
jgi:GNAT superfamily N-acetyltransferase